MSTKLVRTTKRRKKKLVATILHISGSQPFFCVGVGGGEGPPPTLRPFSLLEHPTTHFVTHRPTFRKGLSFAPDLEKPKILGWRPIG